MSIFHKSISKRETDNVARTADLLKFQWLSRTNMCSAFSLMEMMVVMLVVAIILALSSPMITKKHLSDSLGVDRWSPVSGGGIAFNENGDDQTVVIGGGESALQKFKEANNNVKPSLLLRSKDNHPQIGFLYGEPARATGSLLVADGMALGNKTEAKGLSSIAIGNNITVANVASHAIAIGNNAGADNKDALAIGANAKTISANAIALGYNSYANGANSIAIGGMQQ